MIHLGDICKINGAEIPPVDVITGGSPCQDLSIAGKRAGLDGERSGLFMEQIRIVKEMREHDRRSGRTGWMVRPRYMVWENVPGAFSSNGGGDFQAVLTEIVRIAEPDAPDVPMPDKGRWPKSGCLYGVDRNWSISYRVHDAQFWGVPQRRKRISLVADFGGLSAPEILFERKGLSGNSEQGGEKGERTADETESGAGGAICLQGNGIDRADTAGCNGAGWRRDASYTLNTIDRPAVVSFQERAGKPGGGKGILIQNDRVGALSTLNNQSVCAFAQNQRQEVRDLNDCAGSLSAEPGIHQQTFVCYGFEPGATQRLETVYDARGNGDGDTVPTLTGDHGNRVTDYMAICCDVGFFNSYSEQATSLLARQYKDHPMITQTYQKRTGSLMASGYSKNGTQEAANGMYITGVNTVRRLTPMECERLQGYPDGWTDIGEWTDSEGKKHKDADSPRYKALGNSIALPFWEWMARRIAAQYERPLTMGSLFDGIGGFPLAFAKCGGKPVWASEIEEFPIAVVKQHFGDDADGTRGDWREYDVPLP